ALLTRDSRISEAETNADGVVQIPYGDKKVENYRLVVRHDNDFAVNTADSQQTAMRDDWMGYTYTDRPVYRPGHTVHFKSLVRQRQPVGYGLPAGRTVSVEIMDPDQKPVYQKTLTVTPTG